MKVLNLYSGIGGNRKYWENVEVTAVEYEADIADIYKEFYPNDIVVVGDAHQYLIDHYKEFDFIWASPPCPTHSRTNFFLNGMGIVRYPDMNLYQEIIFLQHFFKGKYCVENVVSYYDPLIKPQESGRHFFWANFKIPKLENDVKIGRMNGTKKELNGETTHTLRSKTHEKIGLDLSNSKHNNKEKLLNNCCDPKIGLAILNAARGIIVENSVKPNQLF